jgi:hypothetical protein
MAEESAPKKAAPLRTPTVRLSFPHLFEPSDPIEGSTDTRKKYRAMLIFDLESQKTEEFKAMKAAATAAAVKKFGATKAKELAQEGKLRSPFRKAEEKPNFDGLKPGYLFINVTSLQKPVVIGPQMQPIGEDEVYPGCYVRALISCYAYEKLGNRGVSYGLNHIQKVRNGESLGNRVRAEEGFEPLAEEDGDDGDSGSAGVDQGNDDIAF